MNHFLRPLCALAIVAGGSLGIGATQQTFRATVELVRVDVSVIGEDGLPVKGLDRGRFEVRENGAPQSISVFDFSPVPVTISVVLDLSESLIDHVPAVEQAILEMIPALTDVDRMAISSLDQQGALRSGPALLRADLANIDLGQESWIWNALQRSATLLTRESGRRAVVLVTDGRDNAEWLSQHATPTPFSKLVSSWKPTAVTLGLDHWGVQLYVVAIGDPSISREFREVADSSGGFVRTEDKGSLSAETLSNLVATIRHQYVLGYRPPSQDGGLRKIDVRVKSSDALVRHRRSYVAGR